MLDHDTDSYYKIARAFVDGQPTGGLTRDHILDNVTLYWLTGTGASSARSYWEGGRAAALAAGKTPPAVIDPGRLHHLPRRDLPGAAELGRARLPDLAYFNEVDRGGHFAAWEEPELFIDGAPQPPSGRCADRRKCRYNRPSSSSTARSPTLRAGTA